MGLERITMILQYKDDVYETDLLATLIEGIETSRGGSKEGPEGLHRVISITSSLLCHRRRGILPMRSVDAFEHFAQGESLRIQLGMEKPFLHELVPLLTREMAKHSRIARAPKPHCQIDFQGGRAILRP